jgi:predicted short-subunit dehydrogenase-like oxidoreductase (DUF2520 family)
MIPAERSTTKFLVKKTLTIIGCGKVGRTLGRLWAGTDVFALHDVLNRSLQSAQDAVAFVGAGQPIDAYADLRPADIYLIAAPDDHIADCCDALAASGQLSSACSVFHCSGALSASALRAATQCGTAVASVHPIRSFARPEQLVHDFAGTYCGAEGDRRALDILGEGFAAIGAKLVAIDSGHKILYHAAAVFASNYLVTLLDVAQQAYVEAGIAPAVALKLMEPLVRETADNIFRLGPPAALTGPVARGDTATVERQQKAVAEWHPAYGGLYRDFATLTAELAARRNSGKS